MIYHPGACDLESLLARFSGFGIEADISTLTESELRALWRSLVRLGDS